MNAQRGPGLPGYTVSPPETRAKRIEFSRATTGSWQRLILGLEFENGSRHLNVSYRQPNRRGGRVLIFRNHASLVKRALRGAKSGISGRHPGGAMVSDHTHVICWGWVFGDTGKQEVVFGRARPDGTHAGAPICLTGHELFALELGLAWLTNDTNDTSRTL